jgi:hypothetical protein
MTLLNLIFMQYNFLIVWCKNTLKYLYVHIHLNNVLCLLEESMSGCFTIQYIQVLYIHTYTMYFPRDDQKQSKEVLRMKVNV